QSAIGGTLLAKCWARWSWSPRRIETPHSPAPARTSKSEASRAIETPTSDGTRESERSDETVSPARRPSSSAMTTETPEGQRRKSARCSAPISSTGRGYRTRRNESVAEGVGDERQGVQPPREVDVAGEEDRSLAHERQVAGPDCELVDPGRERAAPLLCVQIGRERAHGAIVHAELPPRIAAGGE